MSEKQETSTKKPSSEVIATSPEALNEEDGGKFENQQEKELEELGKAQQHNKKYYIDDAVHKKQQRHKLLIGLGIIIVLIAAAVLISLISYLVFGGPVKPGPVTPETPQQKRINFFKTRKTVLLISIDGFRADYMTVFQDSCPTLWKLAQRGLRARKMIPSFPTLTFPNHYTIVTGLYPESHGIVANTFRDSEFNAVFSIGSPEAAKARWWEQGEPLWVTMAKEKRTTASMFWVGADVPIHGVYPTYYEKYSDNYPNEQRIQKILEWLDKPLEDEQIPSFLTLYFSVVDHQGHAYGPLSEEVKEAIEEVDENLEDLLEALEQRQILDHLDIMVVSDHGMAHTPLSNYVYLNNYVNSSVFTKVNYNTNGPMLLMSVKNPADIDSVYQTFKNANIPHVSVYKKEEVPERLHYKNNKRITDLVFLADDGYVIRRSPSSSGNNLGTHGYDNQLDSVAALFVASGPSFKSGGQVVEPFQNIHLYGLMAKILEVKNPAPNNGTISAVQHLLK